MCLLFVLPSQVLGERVFDRRRYEPPCSVGILLLDSIVDPALLLADRLVHDLVKLFYDSFLVRALFFVGPLEAALVPGDAPPAHNSGLV